MAHQIYGFRVELLVKTTGQFSVPRSAGKLPATEREFYGMNYLDAFLYTAEVGVNRLYSLPEARSNCGREPNKRCGVNHQMPGAGGIGKLFQKSTAYQQLGKPENGLNNTY